MKESAFKYLFYISSAFLLMLMIVTSLDAGITCDEILHNNQSVAVYNYFSSHGVDQSALNTPVTHLKYYGQSYDNLATILIKWLNIDDVYLFRHIMSTFAGWLAILVTALFAVWLAGYRAGLIVFILFAASPTFIGHSQNNLKDIPFALAYISATYYILKFMISGRKNSVTDLILLAVSISFSMSIRAGGMLLICYLFFFFILYYIIKYIVDNKIDYTEVRTKLLLITVITIVSWLLSTILWPFALQNPFRNVIESYRVMAHFPDTFRQIFEGKVEWSDFMPWYYIPKSMAITIPIIVLTGLISFILLLKKNLSNKNNILYAFVIFTVLFPLLFIVYEKSNVYSSWRQFLFVYPAIVLLAATGFHFLFEYLKWEYSKWIVYVFFAALLIHPLKFMIKNHPYYYMYYNQLVGGLKGAYGNYETDYYYVTQKEASEWLIKYLREKNINTNVKVKATYSILWLFRNHPEIETSYFRYEERSMSDWDYAIIVNRYIPPFQLKNNIWPPADAIHIIYADQVPVCSVIERKSKDDYNGYIALTEGRYSDAVDCFENVLKVNDKDEMIFYNFAAALYNNGKYHKADSVLKIGLRINPDSDQILMYLGNIASSQNKTDEAIMYYGKVIKVNKKYFEAYVALSELLIDSDLMRARALLRTCLNMNPVYKPAIIALADTYRNSDPDIAKKYDELANTINN